MSLILNYNVAEIHTNNNLFSTNRMVSKSMQKLSSGYKVTLVADAPSGLASTEKMICQINELEPVTSHNCRTNSVVGLTESALVEMNEILRNLRAFTLNVANTEGALTEQYATERDDQACAVYGLPSMAAASLGKVTVDGKSYTLQDVLGGGKASLAKDPVTALQVISQAIDDISDLRDRLDEFQVNMLQTNINSLEVVLKNLASTESALREANLASEVICEMQEQTLHQFIG